MLAVTPTGNYHDNEGVARACKRGGAGSHMQPIALTRIIMFGLFLLAFIFPLQCSTYHHEESPLTSSCPGSPNVHPPWDGSPTLLTSVANGSLYTAGVGDDQIYGE